jgi:hypothetical protein
MPWECSEPYNAEQYAHKSPQIFIRMQILVGYCEHRVAEKVAHESQVSVCLACAVHIHGMPFRPQCTTVSGQGALGSTGSSTRLRRPDRNQEER